MPQRGLGCPRVTHTLACARLAVAADIVALISSIALSRCPPQPSSHWIAAASSCTAAMLALYDDDDDDSYYYGNNGDDDGIIDDASSRINVIHLNVHFFTEIKQEFVHVDLKNRKHKIIITFTFFHRKPVIYVPR